MEGEVQQEEVQTEEQITEELVQQEGTEEQVQESETTEEVEESTEETTEEATDEGADEESEVDLSGLRYGDLEIDVDIPTEVNDMLKEKGFDAQALTKELYEGGEISLPQETMDALYEAYGKFQVDNYLSGLKNAAELIKYSVAEQTAELEKANSERWDAALEIVGSEEGWSNIGDWLQSPESSELISDDELSQFNEVMDSGSAYMQRLAVESINNRYRSTLAEDAPELNLMEGKGNREGVKSQLSSSEYHDLITSGDYHKADAKQRSEWDGMRRKAMDKGL